jgi:lipopolysaccharide export system ATP-binding protein
MSKLEVKDIHKSYKSKKVVQGASFKVESQQIIGLLGPNGAGKTTSFYMTLGVVDPDKGQILLDDIDITHDMLSEKAKKGISYLPQEASIFRKMTVEQNIRVALEAQDFDRQKRNLKLQELISDFGLDHIRKSLGMSLSGGERRRVEIARALAGEPKFLFLDEPFAGIDPLAVAEIKKIIKKLQAKGLGIFITDHNVRETLEICEYAYLLKSGTVIVEGTPKEITESALAREFYLGDDFKL